VGEIKEVNSAVIKTFWKSGQTPIVSSLCADDFGQLLNINADTLSSELALALKVDRLISVSDVDGIFRDPARPETLIPSLDLNTARAYLADGVFLDGMIPKVQNAIHALENGVRCFQVLSGSRENSVLEGVEGQGGTTLHR
jgi:acetylglutamate kinase